MATNQQSTNQQRMSHQQVLKLNEALTREINHHRALALSTEGGNQILVRAVVTGATSMFEGLYDRADPREYADMVRKLINEEMEAELQRQYSGQDIRPMDAGEARIPEVQHTMPDSHFSKFINEALASESFKEMSQRVLQQAIDEHLAFPESSEFGPKYMQLVHWTTAWVEEGWLDDGMLEDAVADALIPLVFGKEA